MRDAGRTVWLTGLPSSGKTTLAQGVAAWLRERGEPVEVLDGDEIRSQFGESQLLSPEDRLAHVRRVGWVAGLLAKHGVTVLVAVIAPYAVSRADVRRHHEDAGLDYLEVHVSTPVEICADRDVKGLYRRQRTGRLRGLTGVDAPYEVPVQPDLRVPTEKLTVEEAVLDIVASIDSQRNRQRA